MDPLMAGWSFVGMENYAGKPDDEFGSIKTPGTWT
jgi:hypothetical protein